MGKPGKFYCHYEAAEVTTPFVIEPELTFASVAEAFCAKYNAKHGAGPGELRGAPRWLQMQRRVRGIQLPGPSGGDFVRACVLTRSARFWQAGNLWPQTSSSRLAVK